MVVLVEVVLVVLVVLVVGEGAAGGGVGRWLPGCDVSFDSRGAPLFPRTCCTWTESSEQRESDGQHGEERAVV